MINLCLVVIATQFSETKKREIERMAVERARRRRRSPSSSTATSRASVNVTHTAGCYEELLAFLGYLARLAQRRAARLVLLCGRRWRRHRPAAQAGPLQVYSVMRPRGRRKIRKQRRTPSGRRRTGARRRPGEAPCASPELSDVDLTASPRRRQKRPAATTTGGELGATASTDLLSLPPTFSGSLNKNVLTPCAIHKTSFVKPGKVSYRYTPQLYY